MNTLTEEQKQKVQDISADYSASSRELTPQEQALLEKYINFYLDLEAGRRKPTTDAQEHFVKFSRGLVAAETIHELAFAKHMRLRAALRARRRTGGADDSSDEPRAEWFSREDWYKSRGRQRNDMRD